MSGLSPQGESWDYADLFVVIAAFRYALPRASYAPGLVADWIEARKRHLPMETRDQIAKEIRTECKRNDASKATRRSFLPIPYADRWLTLADSLERIGAEGAGTPPDILPVTDADRIVQAYKINYTD